jgi:biopolymer transport protein TolR
MKAASYRWRERRRKPMADINVVPYIDVMLVLLIIFMVTAPMLQTGVEVDLPRAEAKVLDADKDLPIVVTIDAGGQLFLDAGNRGDQPVAATQLTARIAEALAKKPGLSVLIRGDHAVDYGRVIGVMSALKKAGVPNVGLMTAPVAE